MISVRLRPIRMADAETCLRWVSDAEVLLYLGLVQPARTLDQERAWIAGILADKAQQRVFVIEDARGAPIGTCGLRGIDRDAGLALLGIMIGEKRLWNQGYGTAAVRALLEEAFEELDLREVRLRCHPENAGALRCYEKVGFRPSSHTPDESRYGRDEVRMTIFREDWDRSRDKAGDAGEAVGNQ